MAQIGIPKPGAAKPKTAKTETGRTETAKHRPNLQVEFNKIQKAVDQCRCPEQAAARASLMAVQNQVIQDTVALDELHRAPAADAEAPDAPTPSPAIHEPETEPDSSPAPERAPLVTETRAAIVLSALALLTSLAAMGLWLRLQGKHRGWRRKELELEGEITARVDELDARVPKTIMRTRKAAQMPRSLPRQLAKASSPLPVKPPAPEPELEALAEMHPEIPPEPALQEPGLQEPGLQEPVLEEPDLREPGLRGPAGDALTDYQYATTLGEGAEEDWFREHYRCTGLSCVNLNDHRLGTEALYFQADPRGKFLLVEQGGQAEVLPTFGFDFAAGRASFEGVYRYPTDSGGPLTLIRPALVERSGERSAERWTLAQPGEFDRG